MLKTSKLLVIGKTWPEPGATAAGQRMVQLLKLFRANGYDITFCSTAIQGSYSYNLEGMGIKSRKILLNDDSFDQFLAEEEFETVVFDRFMTEEQFGWRVKERLPEALRILDTEDLHSLRNSRKRSLAAGLEWSQALWMADSVFYREMASLFRCDYNLVISSYELGLLRQAFPVLRERLVYLPFQFTKDEGQQPGFEARKNFIFVGNGKHNPNLDAIGLLIEKIWPVLGRKLPLAELHIYGAYFPESIQQRAQKTERLHIRGWVEDLRPVMQAARLQLAPLRFGAGVKGKILQGLTFGLPTLTTPIGAEGIYDGETSDVLAVDQLKSFAEKAEKIYSSQSLWEQALGAASKAAGDHFQPLEIYGKELLQKLESPRPGYPDSESGRLAALLGTKAFDSSRYLSKWISEKNQKGPVGRKNPE